MANNISLPAQIDWASERKRYPAAQDWVYLNGGSRGLLSSNALELAHRSLDDDLHMRLDSPDHAGLARQRFAQLIHAQTSEIAITKNVSEGLNVVATAIDWRAGDKLVMCSELEHANNIYLWQSLRAQGVEICDVPARSGQLDVARLCEQIDARTRMVTISSISFTPGFKADVAAVGKHARDLGAFFLVDAVQSCGVSAINVQSQYIDALATSTSKGLLGLRGLGFLYVNHAKLAQLTPRHIARTSIDVGAAHYSQYEGPAYTLREDARRFECGNLNHFGAAVAAASLADLLRLGIQNIEQRTTALASLLADGLAEQGWPVLRDPAGDQTHLVCMGSRGNGGAVETGDMLLDTFSKALDAAKVRHAIRRNLLRFGFHFYNDESDVQAVLEIARKHRA